MKSFNLKLLAIAVSSACAANAWATNGMNMEGYGSIATAMGGASMAYDNGNSAAMNNPATLGLMPEGSSRLDLGVRRLGPDVNTSVPSYGIDDDSDGTAYWMPSISYLTKSGKLTYGATVLAQGGMGTEYGRADYWNDLFYSGCSMMDPTCEGGPIFMSGETVRSEVGFGRLSLPVVYSVNDRLNVAGQLDLVLGGLDMQMDMSGAQFGDMFGAGLVGGSMASGLGEMMYYGILTDVDYARFDFSNSSDFIGIAQGYGIAGKLGFTYDVNDRLRIGGTYHTKTSIKDLETDEANLSMVVDIYVDQYGMPTPEEYGGVLVEGAEMNVSGTIKAVDFEWPAAYALGLSYQATDKLMIVADVKRVEWSNVMDTFKLSFKADNSMENGPFAGADLDVRMPQNWDDQMVYSIGFQYQVTPEYAIRAGYNYAENPVPDSTVHPLFPATVEEHLSAGFGYKISDADAIDLSLTYVPENKVKSPQGFEITHSQLNWTFNYVHTF